MGNLTHDGTHKRTRFHHGLIAQEVAELIARTGIDFGGYQDRTIKGGDDALSLGYDEFIAPLIKAVQELAGRNEELLVRHDDLATHHDELAAENAEMRQRLSRPGGRALRVRRAVGGLAGQRRLPARSCP